MTDPAWVPTGDSPNPAWNREVRWRVERALSEVLRVARDVQRYTDEQGLFDVPTSGVVHHGDVTGVAEAGRVHVIEPLQAALDRARAVIAETYREVDDYKRDLYGPGYRPSPRDDRSRPA